MAELIEGKSEFARRIAVKPARITQMIQEGKIPPEALVGEGRTARIRVHLALKQIAQKRDIGQALGNGLGTRLDGVAPEGNETREEDPEPDLPLAPREPSVEDEIKQERLIRERRANRQAQEADALRRGALMETAQARAEMNKITSRMLVTFEGALPDFASALAAKFEIPQRDILHVLRREFTRMRSNASKREAARAEELPTHSEVVMADD
ncbi:MAG: hypothetical protein KKB37_11285 [Alphaproteobacteria bacterium]|nr:hypothetical protein [Alphaproteobacteria bacterium]